jgi:hemerythrin superfamily protein
MTQTRHDVVTVLINDHRAVERVFTELEQGDGSPRHRRELADHVIAELVRHSVAEEQYLYPAARASLGDGDEIADHEIAEHAEAERTMKELDGLEPTDPRFDQLLGKLMREIRHHIEDEESDLFPRLRQACSETELGDLGEKIMRAKEVAPTRPHPSAPDTPPMNKILGPGVGLVDRMRDALSGRTT